MTRLLLATLCVLLWATASTARPLLVEWPVYQPTVPVASLVLYRNTNGGLFIPVLALTDFTICQYVDLNVKFNRVYCYKTQVLTPAGTPSAFSEQGCGRPQK